MFENRRWLVIPTEITGSIDFNEVLESSVEGLRLSLDGTQTFVKYDVTEVTSSFESVFINAESGEEITETVESGVFGRPSVYSEEYNEYNYQEILSLLSTNKWSVNNIKE
jgi:hypothetical protein